MRNDLAVCRNSHSLSFQRAHPPQLERDAHFALRLFLRNKVWCFISELHELPQTGEPTICSQVHCHPESLRDEACLPQAETRFCFSCVECGSLTARANARFVAHVPPALLAG